MITNMENREQMDVSGADKVEVVVAVFESHDGANRAAAALQGPDLKVQKVSRKQSGSVDELPDVIFDDVENLNDGSATKGAVLGGTIGASSGLLFLGIPGLNVAAPIAGMLAGAWIGSIAGLAEADRVLDLPDREDYQQMLAVGKSFVVIAGDEQQRTEYAQTLSQLGADEIFQHPPLGHTVRSAASGNG